MRAVIYKTVLYGLLRRLGEDPATASSERLLQCAEAIADRFRDAFEYYRWPEYLLTEQRYFRDVWASGAYDDGDEVYHADTDAYYQADGAITAEVPGTDAEWVALTDFHKYIAYEQTGKTAIGAVLGVHSKDPRVYATALRVGFSVGPLGITVPPSTDLTSVWLTYRVREVDLAWTEVYSESATYDVGDIVYYATTGGVYECAVATSAGEDPVDTAASWTLREFPHRLARAVKAGARADMLGVRGQEEKEGSREPKFEELLEDQVWQLTKLQGQTGQPSFVPQP